MRGYLFPGQGSQFKGMGRDLFASEFFPPSLEAQIDSIVGYSLRNTCLNGPEDHLRKTEITQPCLYVVNALHYRRELAEGGTPAFLAGHSLGEYNALLAADAFDFLTGLRLVVRRGQLMAGAPKGSMAAVLGLNAENIARLLSAHGLSKVDVANFNTPTQTVISGPSEDVARAQGALIAAGASGFIPLQVGAPFHSRYMAAAAQEFAACLSEVKFQPLKATVISNVTARPYPDNDHLAARNLLARQIDSQVLWSPSIGYLKAKSVTEFVEIGPGATLTRMLPQIPAAELGAADMHTAVKRGDDSSNVQRSKSNVSAGTLSGGVERSLLPDIHGSSFGPPTDSPVSRASAVARDGIIPVAEFYETVLPTNGEMKGFSANVLPISIERAACRDVQAEAEPVSAIYASRPGSSASTKTGTRGELNGHMPTLRNRAEEANSRCPRFSPEALGSASFRADYGVRYAYVAGSMYKGISSKEMVVAMTRRGLLSFFGSSGLDIRDIEEAIEFIKGSTPPGAPFGMNLSNNRDNPNLEGRTVDLLLRSGVTNVEVGGYLSLTPALVRYRLKGLSRAADGTSLSQHRIMAKVSRPEIAAAFMRPAPASIVSRLLESERISRVQAELAPSFPMADDICVEVSGEGRVGGGNLLALFPAVLLLRDEISCEYNVSPRIRIGAAGGIGDPHGAAAAFVMGADFILTGSINQCSVEAGTSEVVKDLLQTVEPQDTTYAPSGEMFEYGAHVPVVRKGLFFHTRANRLHDLYMHHNSIDEMDVETRHNLERKIFKKTLADVWIEAKEYYRRIGRADIAEIENQPKQKMALIFKWYFLQGDRGALTGDRERKVDYLIQCGPALGAFNRWVKGTPTEPWRKRHVADIAECLMHGAAELLTNFVSKHPYGAV